MIKYERVVITVDWIAVIRYLSPMINLTNLMDRSYAFYLRLELVINICLDLPPRKVLKTRTNPSEAVVCHIKEAGTSILIKVIISREG